MKRYKFVTTLIIFLFIVISGVFVVNIRYTKDSGKTISKSIFAQVNGSMNAPGLSNDAIYSEICLSGVDNKKLYTYINLRPFDLRFSMGEHILYVNGNVFSNFGENIKQLVTN